jgi:hypothetical protein
MALEKRPTYVQEYFRMFMGLIIFLTGCLLMAQSLTYDSYSLWLVGGLIILGGIMAATGDGAGIIFGVLLLLTGGSILLHRLGILSGPYFVTIISWVFLILGGLQMLVFAFKIYKKWKTGDPGDTGVDDLDKVDY